MIVFLVCFLCFLQTCLISVALYISKKQIKEALKRDKKIKEENTSLILENINLKIQTEDETNEEKKGN